MLEIRNLYVSYNNINILDYDSLSFPKGLNLIVGKSGCGKTTLLYILSLMSEHSGYEYIYDNHKVDIDNKKERSTFIRKNISYVTQDSDLFYDLSVLENLELYASINNKVLSEEEYQNILHKVHLDIPLNQIVSTLSGGQKQRLSIACALVRDTDIILLDEPTSALDKDNSRIIFELCKELALEDKTIIVSSHNRLFLEYADTVLDLENKTYHTHKEIVEEVHHKKDIKGYQYLKQYIQYFLKAYKKTEILLTSILIISLLLTGLSQLLINNSTQKSMDSYQKLSDNIIFVSKTSEYTHIDETLEPFKFNNKSIPYLKTYLETEESIIPIIPLYDNQDISQSIVVGENRNILLSHTCAKELHIYTDLSSIKGHITIEYYKDDKPHYVQKDYLLKPEGILSPNVQSAYLKKSQVFIYMNIHELEKLQSSCLKDADAFVGYTILEDNYLQYQETVEDLENKHYGVLPFFDYIDEMNELLEMNTILKMVCLIIITVISCVLILLIEFQYFKSRYRVFLLLKMNGIDDNQLILLLIVEELLRIMIGFILSVVVFSILSYLDIIKSLCISITIILLLSYMMYRYFIYHLSIEEGLRNAKYS